MHSMGRFGETGPGFGGKGDDVTEAEWHTHRYPTAMLAFLDGRASGRKLRLYCCACCRTVWNRLLEPELRKAIELSEAFVDDPSVGPSLRQITAVVRDRNDEDWTNGFWGEPTNTGF